MTSWILAIDFGTSYTVAAAKVGDRAPEIVEIGGERRMPSVVMVDSGGVVFVGRAAEDLSVAHPGSTLRALKNRLGDQTPAILDGRPHQVVSLVGALLGAVYEQVVVQVGEPPGEVRLTHPATWNKPRINRLIEAAAKAGLPNPLLVPEPVAAALSYAADVGLVPGRPIAVYDLGGGTFDSAVVTARDGGFAVVGRPGGDQHIGGELFDELVVNHIGEMLDPATWEAIQVGDDALWRQVGAALRNEARKAKEALSSHPFANLLVPLPAGLWQVRFTRDEFHDIVRPYIAETITTLQRCVEQAGVQVEELAGISLVGGCSRSPIVEEMVRAAFPTVVVSRRGDPKATVAAGATLAERPISSLPGVWRSPVTQEASPGTAHQRARLAPPPISQPSDDTAQRPSDRPPDSQPANPPAPWSNPPSGPVSNPPSGPVSNPPSGPVSSPPSGPVSSPPAGPVSSPPATPVAKSAQLPTVALPISGYLQPEAGRSGTRSRKPLVVVAALLVAGALIAGVILARRSDDDASISDSSQATSQLAIESVADSTDVSGSDVPGTSGDSVPQVSSPATDSEDTSGTNPDTDPESTVTSQPIGTKVDTLAGHKREVLMASFSPDDSRLVTASLDGLAIVWDLATGTVADILASHTDEVYSADFSPDGSLIATTGADSTVRLWDANSGIELYTLRGHGDVVYQVTFSPDGAHLLSASRDRTARLWDVASGEAVVFTGSAEAVYSAEFSPDGSFIVAGGQDDVVRVWSVSAPDEPLLFEGHTADVQTALFSPDQTLIVSASDDGTAKVWEASSGRLIYNFAHGGGVWTASFSGDGAKVISSSSDRTAKIWDVATGDLQYTLSGHRDIVYTSSFNPDASLAVTASSDGTAKIWDVGTGAEVANLAHLAPVASAAFSADGRLVVTVSADGTATTWAG